MTEKQIELLRFIESYVDKHGRSPTFREMKAATKTDSLQNVVDRVRALERDGLISRHAFKARSIRVLVRSSDIAAGCKVVSIMGKIS